MKFLALITTFFLFLSPVTILLAEEVETEENPIVETVEEEEEVIPGFTEEELDKAISDWFANATEQTVEFSMSLWNQLLTVLGVSSFTGLLVLVHWMLKKFGAYNGLLNNNSKVIDLLTKEIAGERKDIDEMRKTFMALLTMLNIDPRVKTTLIDRLASGGTVQEFADAVKQVELEQDNEIDEVASLLEQISK